MQSPHLEAVLAGTIIPQSASSGAKTSEYVSMATFSKLVAYVQVGATASGGTVDAKLVQATAAAGTGSKDISGKAITQLTAAAGTATKREATIDCLPEDLDVAGGFTHVALVITPATAAALLAGCVVGLHARFNPADDVSTVAQVIG